MSKWRTTCNRNENIEFSDYHKMRNCTKLEGQSCSPYVVGCKTNINMNGMDESSPSYNRIVRPIMVMPQTNDIKDVTVWNTEVYKNGDLIANCGGWLWDNLALGAGYEMASYKDYVAYSKQNSTTENNKFLLKDVNPVKKVQLKENNFSPQCVFWENITMRTNSPFSAMFRMKQMMFGRTVYKGGKGCISIICPGTKTLNFWVSVSIYDGGFPTTIPTVFSQASNSFTLSPSNPRKMIEFPRAVKKNPLSMYCSGEKNVMEDTKNGFDSNYDYLTIVCIVNFAEPADKYIGKNIGQLWIEFEAEGDQPMDNKAISNFTSWQMNRFKTNSSVDPNPPEPTTRTPNPDTQTLSSPLSTDTRAEGMPVTSRNKDTILQPDKSQAGYNVDGQISILKNTNRRHVPEMLRRTNFPLTKALTSGAGDVFYGVFKDKYLAALSAKQLKLFLQQKYGPIEAGKDSITTNGTSITAVGFNIEDCFKIEDSGMKISFLDAPSDLHPVSVLDESDYSLKPLMCPTAYTPLMNPHTFHFTPSFESAGYTAHEFSFDETTSYTVSLPFLYMPCKDSRYYQFANRAYTPYAPEITLHTTTIITNPLANDDTAPLCAGCDKIIDYDKSSGDDFVVKNIKLDMIETKRDSTPPSDIQYNNIVINIPKELKDMPDIRKQYVAAKKQAHVANAFNIMGFLSGAAKTVKGALNSLLLGEAPQPKNVSFISKICRAQNNGLMVDSNAGATSYIGETPEGYSYVIATGNRAKLTVPPTGEEGGNIYNKKFYDSFPCANYELNYSGLDFNQSMFVRCSAKLQINPGLKFSISNPYGYCDTSDGNGLKLSMLLAKNTTESVLKQPSARSLIIPVLMASRYPPNDENCMKCAVPLTNPSNNYSMVSNALPPMTSYNTYDFNTTGTCDNKKMMMTRGLNVSFNYDSVVSMDCSFYIPDMLPTADGTLQKLEEGAKMYVFLALVQSYTLIWGNQPLEADLKDLAIISLHKNPKTADGSYIWTDVDHEPMVKSAAVFVTVSCDNRDIAFTDGVIDVVKDKLYHQEAIVKGAKQDDTMKAGFQLISSSFSTEVTVPIVEDFKGSE